MILGGGGESELVPLTLVSSNYVMVIHTERIGNIL